MTARPIPAALLRDSFTLLVPDGGGYDRVAVTSVRVVRRSQIREYSAVVIRDESDLTVYYDCANSLPAGLEFEAGMKIEYGGRNYAIISVERFDAQTAHHYRLKAVLV